MNRNLRELHLAENKLTPFDALQLGILLSGNSSLQHVDLRYKSIWFESPIVFLFICYRLLIFYLFFIFDFAVGTTKYQIRE